MRQKIVSPADIAAAREAAGLTQEQAAVLVHVKRRTWQDWELGIATIPGAAWELFCIKTGLTPSPADTPA